ncbi:uncharacterized protein LOC110828291 [Zootermopsis nevadensis]|uniref:Uncharacterized protein n=1 Tax=Zootermopsis nevadensis TaxID=136037 RepID=A0A067RBU5_ZOONE|nr:uncharacterized protein LOC110828291 [Zootermopsis nevadensis]KDR21212.1 hypothetical protein L798_03619 [Zootermopsis nevadensis]
MIYKPLYWALATFIFVYVLCMAKCADKTSDSSIALTNQLCKLSHDLEPFAPWSHQLATEVNDAGSGAEVFVKQLRDDCRKLKARTLTGGEKVAIANGLRNFGTNSRIVIANLSKMTTGGGYLMDQFFVIADKLNPITEK